MYSAPEAQLLGKDKLGYRWIVEVTHIPPAPDIQLAQVSFKVFLADEKRSSEQNVPGRAILSMTDEIGFTAKIEEIRISSTFENRGIGSMLLSFIEEQARLLGITRLTGELSLADAGHFSKLKHFYEKLGFRFCLDDKPVADDPAIIGQIHKLLVRF